MPVTREAAGTGPSAFGAFTNDNGAIVAVVLGGTSLPMATVASSGVTFSGSTATVASAGTYGLSYCVRTTSALLARTRLVVNGLQLDASTISPGASRDTWCRATSTELAAGSTVGLQLFGLLGAATLLAPGDARIV